MIRALLACCVLALLAAGDAPVQGTVVLAERSFTNVWILSETTDGATYTVGEQKDGPPTTSARGKYVRIEYARPNDVNFIRAETFASKGAWEQAAASYSDATRGGANSTWYSREISFVRAAEAYLQANRLDEAIKSIEGLSAAFPKSLHQPRVAFLRGQAVMKKGDAAAAAKLFGDLAKKADWGTEALALGTLGQAELLAADKKPDEAAKLLAGVFARLDASRDRELFGRIGAALAANQQTAGQTEPAIATLRRLAFASSDGAARARAQLAWARLLATSTEAPQLFEAFDHAAMAMTGRDADGVTVQQATQLATQIVGRIDKLPEAAASNAIKAEYRRYLSR